MGQSSTALQQLGRAANTLGDFAKYDKGTFFKGPSAVGFDSACMLLALLFLGMGLFWLCVAVVGILEVAFKRKLTLSLLWWSTIFPVGEFQICFLLKVNI
jgi:tellurite resistance protein TehA-like permease